MPCWCLSKANAPPAGGSTTSDYEASGEPASALKKKLTDAGVGQSEIEAAVDKGEDERAALVDLCVAKKLEAAAPTTTNALADEAEPEPEPEAEPEAEAEAAPRDIALLIKPEADEAQRAKFIAGDHPEKIKVRQCICVEQIEDAIQDELSVTERLSIEFLDQDPDFGDNFIKLDDDTLPNMPDKARIRVRTQASVDAEVADNLRAHAEAEAAAQQAMIDDLVAAATQGMGDKEMPIGTKIHHPELGEGVVAEGFNRKRGRANQHSIDFGEGPVSVELKQFKHEKNAQWQVNGDMIMIVLLTTEAQQPEHAEQPEEVAENYS